MGIREVQAGPSPVMCLHEVPRLLSAILKEGRWQLGWLPAWVEVLRGAEMARQTHQGGSLPASAHQRQRNSLQVGDGKQPGLGREVRRPDILRVRRKSRTRGRQASQAGMHTTQHSLSTRSCTDVCCHQVWEGPWAWRRGWHAISSQSGQVGSQEGRAETRFPLLKVPLATRQRKIRRQEGGRPPESTPAPEIAGGWGADLGGSAHYRTQGFNDSDWTL